VRSISRLRSLRARKYWNTVPGTKRGALQNPWLRTFSANNHVKGCGDPFAEAGYIVNSRQCTASQGLIPEALLRRNEAAISVIANLCEISSKWSRRIDRNRGDLTRSGPFISAESPLLWHDRAESPSRRNNRRRGGQRKTKKRMREGWGRGNDRVMQRESASRPFLWFEWIEQWAAASVITR